MLFSNKRIEEEIERRVNEKARERYIFDRISGIEEKLNLIEHKMHELRRQLEDEAAGRGE